LVINELIFLAQSIFIALSLLAALRLGQEALIALICLQGVLSNLFVVKQINIFSLHATSADAFSVGMILGLNLLQEFYGHSIAKKTIWLNLGCLLFYTIISQIHLFYLPNSFDTMHIHFAPLLSLMPRITLASITVYLIVQFWDAWFYGKLKTKFSDLYFIRRTLAAASISQLIDTVLFSFLGLYGIIEDVWHVIIVSYLIKMVVILITAPFLMLAKRINTATNPR
jgi:uncharacterized integral membrane protein (TIGR00697 family)